MDEDSLPAQSLVEAVAAREIRFQRADARGQAVPPGGSPHKAGHLGSGGQQQRQQVAAQKTRAAGNEDAFAAQVGKGREFCGREVGKCGGHGWISRR